MIIVFRDVLDEFGPSAALVYGVIYGYIKERMTGICLLGADGIATITGLHYDTVRTQLATLCQASWLERPGRPHYYRLTDKAPRLTATRLAKLLDPIGDMCYNRDVVEQTGGLP